MKWLANLFKKDLNTFIRFSVVGAIWTAFNIGSDIILIDHYHLSGWLGALIGYVILYVGRYYSYILLNVIEAKFWKYVYSTIAFTIVMWGMKSFATDIMHLKAALVSPVITGVAFFLKYLFYKRIKLIKTTSDSESDNS